MTTTTATQTLDYAPRTGALRRLDATGLPSLLARLLVGGVMIWMAIPKIQRPVLFLKLVNEYHMIPHGWPAALNLLVIVLPWLEIIAGTALILGAGLRGAAVILTLLLAGFTTVIFIRALQMVGVDGKPFFEIKFDCGCGSGEQIIWKKLLSNLGLIALSAWLVWSCSRRYCLLSETRAEGRGPSSE